jgi:hypothetical protein
MKKFLINSVVFSLFPLVALSTVISIVYSHYYQTLQELTSSFQSVARKELIIAGDSQAQRINGSLIQDSYANIGSSGEHYYFTYKKLKQLLEIPNNQVEQVLLGASIHNFAPVYSKMIDAQLPEGKNSVKSYLYSLKISDIAFLSGGYKNIPVSTIYDAVYEDVKIDGFHESTHNTPTDSVINKIFANHYGSTTDSIVFGKLQKEYLLKIDSLCQAYDVTLYLVSTPYHKKYQSQIDSAYIAYFEQVINETSWGQHINFLNESPSPSLLSDANHLNKLGAEIYSTQIRKLMHLE